MRIPRASRSDSGGFGDTRARFAQLRARGRAESCEFARRVDEIWLSWEERIARAARICARGGAKWDETREVWAARATNLFEIFERAPGEKGGDRRRDLRNGDWVGA